MGKTGQTTLQGGDGRPDKGVPDHRPGGSKSDGSAGG
jgi:hypothetical protein